MQVNNLFRL